MCQVPTEVNFNSPDDIIRFIVDNNPGAVRNNLSRAGLNIGGLTPCLMKDKIISLNNQGYNIRPLLRVPANPNADNYTSAIINDATRVNGKTEFDWSDLGDIFAGLGEGIGSVLGTGAAPVIVQTPEQNYTPFLIGGGIIVAILIIILLKK